MMVLPQDMCMMIVEVAAELPLSAWSHVRHQAC